MEARRLVLVFSVVLSIFPHTLLAKAPLLTMTKRVIKIAYFEQCDQKVYPVVVNLTFGRSGAVLVINGVEAVSRDIKGPIKAKFFIDKCKDKSNPDTCEYYNTWKWDDLCVSHNLPFVKIVVDAFKPPLTCPMKKNHYHIKNGTLQANVLEAFLAHSNPNTLWKFRITMEEGTSEGTIVACVNFGVRLMTTRVRL